MIPYTKLREASHRFDLTKETLASPLSVFIEPTNVCNMKCAMCPQSLGDYKQQAGYYHKMQTATWERVRSELATVSPRVVRFFGEGEPLLNPQLCSMIRSVRGIAERTELATNGTLLGTYAAELVASGLQYVRVSIYGTTDEQYKSETASRYFPGLIRENIRQLRKARESAGSETPWITAMIVSGDPNAGAFRRQFADVADDLIIESLHNWGGSDSRLVQLGEPARAQKLVCPKPFYELMIKANGDVTPCCVDWRGELVVGNILTDSIRDIWNGQRMKDIRERHTSGNRFSLSACRDCTFIERQGDDMDSMVNKLEAAWH